MGWSRGRHRLRSWPSASLKRRRSMQRSSRPVSGSTTVTRGIAGGISFAAAAATTRARRRRDPALLAAAGFLGEETRARRGADGAAREGANARVEASIVWLIEREAGRLRRRMRARMCRSARDRGGTIRPKLGAGRVQTTILSTFSVYFSWPRRICTPVRLPVTVPVVSFASRATLLAAPPSEPWQPTIRRRSRPSTSATTAARRRTSRCARDATPRTSARESARRRTGPSIASGAVATTSPTTSRRPNPSSRDSSASTANKRC